MQSTLPAATANRSVCLPCLCLHIELSAARPVMNDIMNDRAQFLRLLFALRVQLVVREFRERERRRRRCNRRWWVRPIERPREEKSFFLKVMEAKETDDTKFFGYTRCLPFQFDYLVDLLRPLFPRNRSRRAPLPVEFRLAMALM